VTDARTHGLGVRGHPTPGGTPRFQVLDALDPEALGALRADIAAHGVQIPIVVTTAGEVVDGHNRLAIAEELGLDCPSITVDLDDQAATEAALRLNLLRRHMGPVSWAGAFRRLAEVRGVADRIGMPGRPGKNADTLSAISRELGVAPRTARRRLALADRLAEHPQIAAKVDRGELDGRRAEELVRISNFEARRAEAPPPPVVTIGDGIEVRSGDFRAVLADVADGSVDAIVTDPPYDAAGIPLYSELSAFAARVLIPGRLVIAYCGKVDLPEQLERLGEHLAYVWCGAIFLPGRHTNFRARLIRGMWRPVAIFSAGTYQPRHWMIDALMAEGSGAKGPQDHRWQQGLGPFARWVAQVAEPGELVVDPFVGGGTCALACQATARRFLGSDIDPASISLTIERLVAAERPGPP